jgi:hypothetical protein
VALGLVKLLGGAADGRSLAVGVHAAGVSAPTRYGSGPNLDSASADLTRNGLLVASGAHAGWRYSYGEVRVVADRRVLDVVGSPKIEPAALSATDAPPASSLRRPAVVSLDIIGLLQAIDRAGGLKLTREGTVRATEVRKVGRAAGWRDEQMIVDGMVMPNPALAFIDALRESGALAATGHTLALAQPLASFTARPYIDQIRPVVAGLCSSRRWNELDGGTDSYYTWQPYHQGRLGLLVILGALPGDGFYALADVSRVLCERIGAVFSIGYAGYAPDLYGKTFSQIREEQARWQAKRWQQWQKDDQPWLERALSSWAYALGLVELGRDGDRIVSVRLTDLGRALFEPSQQALAMPAAAANDSAWVVQPTFEIIAYLDQATPDQMAFLERHAERVSVQHHVAQYRLTKESVYRGLESGTTADNLLVRLRSGTKRDLPQNVEAEIRSWAALREKVTLRRRASLLQYASGAERQQAQKHGFDGTAVGERFLLCSPATLQRANLVQCFDYAGAPAACLAAHEDGTVTLTRAMHDILVVHYLDRWAQRLPPERDTDLPSWQITQDTVLQALRNGGRVADLLDLLSKRSAKPLPFLLALSLRAWGGEPYDVILGTVTILRCPQPDVLRAIQSSAILKPYLLGMLGLDVIVVDAQRAAELKTLLLQFGIHVGGKLRLDRL